MPTRSACNYMHMIVSHTVKPSPFDLQYRHELNDTFRAKSTARFRTNLTDKISDSRAKSRRSFRERMRKAYVKLPIKYREISRNIAAL